MPIGRYPPSSLFPLFYCLFVFLFLILLPKPALNRQTKDVININYVWNRLAGGLGRRIKRKVNKRKGKKIKPQNNNFIFFCLFSFPFFLLFRLPPSLPSYLKRFDRQRERWPIVVPFEIKLGGRWKTNRETKRNKRKQRTEKPEDKLYFIFVLVFLFVFFSFLFLCPLLTYLISVYKSLETKRKT